MLPDFRFAIGAVLAIAMLGITGFGLVMSVRLMHEASAGSFEPSRSLAFTEQSGWRNQFYDPEAARRFAGLGTAADNPGADAPVDAQANVSMVIALAKPDEPVANPPPTDIGTDQTDDTASTPVTKSAPAPDVPVTNGAKAAPEELDRVASAPATSPQSEAAQDDAPPANPIAGAIPLPPIPAKPVAHARPKRRHIVRAVRPPPQPSYSDSGFPLTNGPWPTYDNQFAPATTAKKSKTQVTSSGPRH